LETKRVGRTTYDEEVEHIATRNGLRDVGTREGTAAGGERDEVGAGGEFLDEDCKKSAEGLRKRKSTTQGEKRGK
jgi:hypothetical protein